MNMNTMKDFKIWLDFVIWCTKSVRSCRLKMDMRKKLQSWHSRCFKMHILWIKLWLRGSRMRWRLIFLSWSWPMKKLSGNTRTLSWGIKVMKKLRQKHCFMWSTTMLLTEGKKAKNYWLFLLSAKLSQAMITILRFSTIGFWLKLVLWLSGRATFLRFSSFCMKCVAWQKPRKIRKMFSRNFWLKDTQDFSMKNKSPRARYCQFTSTSTPKSLNASNWSLRCCWKPHTFWLKVDALHQKLSRDSPMNMSAVYLSNNIVLHQGKFQQSWFDIHRWVSPEGGKLGRMLQITRAVEYLEFSTWCWLDKGKSSKSCQGTYLLYYLESLKCYLIGNRKCFKSIALSSLAEKFTLDEKAIRKYICKLISEKILQGSINRAGYLIFFQKKQSEMQKICESLFEKVKEMSNANEQWLNQKFTPAEDSDEEKDEAIATRRSNLAINEKLKAILSKRNEKYWCDLNMG